MFHVLSNFFRGESHRTQSIPILLASKPEGPSVSTSPHRCCSPSPVSSCSISSLTIYTMHFHINLPLNSSKIHSLFITHLTLCHLKKKNPLSLIYAVHILLNALECGWPAKRTTQRKLNFHLLEATSLLRALQLGVQVHPHLPCVCSGFSSCHKHCKCVLNLENTGMHHLWLLASFCPLFCNEPWASGGGYVIPICHLGVSLLQPHIFCTLTGCGSLC